MDGFRKRVGGAWSSLTAKYPELERIERSVTEYCSNLLAPHSEVYTMSSGQRYRIVSALGQGAYSTVYLAEKLENEPSESPQAEFALKKILLGGPEEEARARREVLVLQQVQHPNVVRLLDAAFQQVEAGDGAPQNAALLVFPVFKGGSVWDAVERARAVGRPLPLRTALSIFIQLCSALEATHEAGWAHRDVKPQNVLLEPQRGGSGVRAVLLDFGSVTESTVLVADRRQAAATQEEAEAHSTAPYRAPELWEVERGATLTDRVDVWGAGCVLYYLAFQASPFERAVDNGAGGSLRLAILNGAYSYPEQDGDGRVEGLRPLIDACLRLDPGRRPTAAQAKLQAQELLERRLSGSAHILCPSATATS